MPRRLADSRSDPQQGIALIMVLIFTILLYVMVAELVTTAQMQRLTGENDALLARIRNQMRYNLAEVYETLIDDAQAAAAQADGGAGGGLAALSGAAAGGDGSEAQASEADSSQDPWYQPIAYSDGELTTNVWVEDENRKFNLLSLISADRDFADESKARFIRLIDYLREDTDYDLGIGEAEEIYTAVMEWMEGRTRTDNIPRPLLKSDSEERRDLTVPLELDELLMLRGINDQLFYDQVVEDSNSELGVQHLLGLESVLTVFTSLRYDPGNPQKLAQQGRQVPESTGGAGALGDPAADQPEGVGIRININTATRPVLRCLLPPHEIPEAVIEGILRYRNEEAEEEAAAADAVQDATGGSADYLGDINEGQQLKLKIFETADDLENVPEFANIANTDAKAKFLELVTTKSDVFTIHLAGLYRRNEERRQFVIRRARSVVVRSANGDSTELYPLILMEDRSGLRIMPHDFEERDLDRQMRMEDMDEFAREERDWNPFFLEFYRPRN